MSAMRDHIIRMKEIAKSLPEAPGVYLMKNAQEKIIYIGKAKSLRARVRSYFLESADHSAKTKFLVRQIQRIETILTGSEVEAFLLEASLIKKHRPKYNIRLKDDKSYPYIRVSMADEFPRLYLARKVKKDGALYFGPYTTGTAVWGTIRFLNQTFRIRDCKDAFMRSRKRPCMTHQIGRCSAPCVKLVSSTQYRADLEPALLFLKGRDQQTLKALNREMKTAAVGERFEAAAKIRDSIRAIESVLEKQSVVSAMSELDQDAIGYFGDDRGTMIQIVHIRAGRLIGTRFHFLPLIDSSQPDEDPREWLLSFLNQYYEEAIVPDELILPIDIGRDLSRLLEAVFKERNEKLCRVRFPTDDDRRRLLEIANQNAKESFGRHVDFAEAKSKALEEIQAKLGLNRIPKRIECYDISTFQGSETVASQVVFIDGVPSKDDYRRYRIQTVDGTDDFRSMFEVISRRLAHTEWDDPDLIVIDGGKGQLNAVMRALSDLGRSELAVVGLAKARTRSDFSSQAVESSEERFFIPGRSNPIVFRSSSEAYRILVGLRDEAHRFAITYHRKLREASSIESALDSILGLGEVKKKRLLSAYSSIDAIRESTAEELSQVEGIDKDLAVRIIAALKTQA